jgi:CubicO group peptidase (beta-lactamase class C family)
MKHFFYCFAVVLFPVFSVFADDYPVKKVLQPFVDNGSMAGMVTIIADKDKILQLDLVGYRDIETKTPMTEDTLFWIASQSKPITAAAVMILVDEGKLALDEPVTTYIPEFKNVRVLSKKEENETVLVPPDKPITLRLLLSHTSGMDWGAPVHRKFSFDILPYSMERFIFPEVPFLNQPGVKFNYSNMGINSAAMIVETVSGMPYFDFLQKRIFEPLGMKDTTFWTDLSRTATAYGYNNKTQTLEVVKNTDRFTHPLDNRERRFPDAAAGLYSTAADLIRFYQMLLGNGVFEGKRILSETSVAEMTKRQTPESEKASYGLGLAVTNRGYSHGGTYGTVTEVFTKRGLIYLYMTQSHGRPSVPAKEAESAFMRCQAEK